MEVKVHTTMIKRILLLVLTAILSMPATGQTASNAAMLPKGVVKTLDKAFNDALKSGQKGPNGSYRVTIKGKVSLEQVSAYAQSKDYVVIEYVQRDFQPDFLMVYFLLAEQVPEWILEKSYKEIVPAEVKDDRYYSKQVIHWTQVGSMIDFDGKRIDGISWTGKILNGMIHGNGIGVKVINDKRVFMVSGDFYNGRIAGEAQYREGNLEDDGFFRIAGGFYRDKNAKKKTIFTNWVITDAGEYAKVYQSGEGVFRMERANYFWNKDRRRPYKEFNADGKYTEGTYWYYIDGNFTPVARFPLGTITEEVQPFKDGKAIVRNCNVHPRHPSEAKETGWEEYYVYRNGKIAFSEAEEKKILETFDAATRCWNALLPAFDKRFAGDENHELLYGVDGKRKAWEKLSKNCVLVNPATTLRAAGRNPDMYATYSDLLRLYRLYHSRSSLNSGMWNKESAIKDALAAYNRESYSYRYNNKQAFYKYLDEEWMTKRLKEATDIVARLKNDKMLNVEGKEGKLDAILNHISDLESKYKFIALNARFDLLDRMDGQDVKSELRGEHFDNSRSKAPTKLVRKQDIFLSWYYEYENEGEIHFINSSEYLKYNIGYKEVGDEVQLDYYLITYCTFDNSIYGKYSTKKEMIEAILNAWAKRYN